MEELKGFIYPLATAIGLGAVWGDLKRRLGNIERRQEAHDDRHEKERYVSQDSLDRTQIRCREQWKGELKHISETLLEIKQDIKDLRTTK